MKKTLFILIPFFLLTMSCDLPINDDTEDPILSKVLRIEAYLTMDDSDFIITHEDGSNSNPYHGTHYIWFTTIEGVNTFTDEGLFHSEFDANVFGTEISGFLDLYLDEDADGNFSVGVDAKRISENSTGTKVYDMLTNLLPETDVSEIDGKIVATYEINGTDTCTAIETTSYTYQTSSYTDAMTAYNCTGSSSVIVKIFYNE